MDFESNNVALYIALCSHDTLLSMIKGHCYWFFWYQLGELEMTTCNAFNIIIGILLYFLDSVLPLVQYFFANLKCLKTDFGETVDGVKNLRVIDLLLQNLMV